MRRSQYHISYTDNSIYITTNSHRVRKENKLWLDDSKLKGNKLKDCHPRINPKNDDLNGKSFNLVMSRQVLIPYKEDTRK